MMGGIQNILVQDDQQENVEDARNCDNGPVKKLENKMKQYLNKFMCLEF